MAVADSPLRDQVLFIEGAPRSGTTWTNVLLASHPEIAGSAIELHLFDRGVGRLFDNHDEYGALQIGVAPIVSRAELADMVRDLCDGVLLRLRQQTKPDARFVVENSPLGAGVPRSALTRKLECYPDAWYLHIVRDGQAVAASLMRAAWTPDPSLEACLRHWRSVVGATREVFGALPRYREIRYEDLRADLAGTTAGIFDWLGVRTDHEILERMELLSKEPYAEQPERSDDGPEVGAYALLRARVGDRVHTARARLGRRLRGAGGPRLGPGEGVNLAGTVAQALRVGDEEALRRLTTDDFVFELRSGSGDLRAVGDEARAALATLTRRVFDQGSISSSWAIADGTPFQTILFTARGVNADRVDLSLHLVPSDGKVAYLVLLSPGDPAGRPLADYREAPTGA